MTTPCDHPTPRRIFQTAHCPDCGATTHVPKCPTCKAKAPDGMMVPRLTTWIIRETALICYKCATAVPGLGAQATTEERIPA